MLGSPQRSLAQEPKFVQPEWNMLSKHTVPRHLRKYEPTVPKPKPKQQKKQHNPPKDDFDANVPEPQTVKKPGKRLKSSRLSK